MKKVCSLLFLKRDDQILLAMKKRGFGANLWNGVGGKVDPGETLEQATIRECQEEIGVTPLAFTKVAHHDFICDATTDPWHMDVHAFFCTEWEGEPIETEEMAPKWFNISDIPYDDMWQDDAMWLPLVLKGKFVESEISFDQDNELLQANVRVVTSIAQT